MKFIQAFLPHPGAACNGSKLFSYVNTAQKWWNTISCMSQTTTTNHLHQLHSTNKWVKPCLSYDIVVDSVSCGIHSAIAKTKISFKVCENSIAEADKWKKAQRVFFVLRCIVCVEYISRYVQISSRREKAYLIPLAFDDDEILGIPFQFEHFLKWKQNFWEIWI